ncbi:MAG: glycosyltransferase family 2 protein [Candidatus Altiarchaeota archaeon]|nr:glycosyltransferase family 2 protein [Candidatus Altiarchaeota archaeon]
MIAAIIPAKNEEKHISDVVKQTKKYVDLVMVIDDGSADNTAELARAAGAKVVKLSKNMGKGYAVRIGVERAAMEKAEIIVLIDGDGQHNPDDIPKLLKDLDDADIVFGQRKGGKMPIIKRFGNWFLQRMFDLLFGYFLEDTQCGFRAFRTVIMQKIMWKSKGYFMDTEIAARAGTNKLRINKTEIPIVYHNPIKGTGILDGLEIGVKMLWLRTRLLRS